MAVTVEELQILLSCDATQAEAVLDQLTKKVDKAVAKMNGSIGNAVSGAKAGGGSKRNSNADQTTYYDKLVKQIDAAKKKLDRAQSDFSFSDDDKSKINVEYYSQQLESLTKKYDKLSTAADKANAKLAETTPQLSSPPTVEYRGGSQPVPYKGWQPVSASDLNNGYVGDMMRRAQAFMNSGVGDVSAKLQSVDTAKLTGGSEYEQLAEKLKVVENQAESLRQKIANIGDASANPQAVMTLQTKLETAERKAEKLAEAMAKIEDSAGKGDGAKEDIEQTGNSAEEATPKVEKYNKEVGKSSKQGGFFSKVSGAAHKAFSKFGSSFKHHEGFLSKFGKTLKRVMMRMLAMGLIRGVLNSITKGISILGKASTTAQKQINRFTALGNSVKVAFGSAALSVLNMLAPILYRIASAAITAANAVSRFFAVFGSGKYFAVELSDGLDSVGESAGGAGGKVKGLLADFDELNIIGQQGGGGGGGGSANIGNTNVSEQDASSILADLIKNDEFEKAGEYINKKLGEISDKIAKWFTDLDKKKYGKKFAELLNGIFSDPTAFEKAGKAVGTGVNTIVNTIYDFLTTFDAGKAARSLASGLNSLVQEIDWAHIGEMFGEGVNDIFEYLYNFFTTFDFIGTAKSFATSLNSLVETIDWNEIGATILQALLGLIEFVGSFLLNVDWGSLIRGLFSIIVGFIEEICKNPRRLVKALLHLVGGVANVMYGLIGGVISGILDILATIFPGLKGWGDKVQEFFTFDTSMWEQAVDIVCDEIFGAEETVSDMADTVSTKTSEMGSMFDGLRSHVDDYAKSVDGLSSAINKIPSSKTTKYTFKANVEATTSGSSNATVNKPNINISMAMASGGIAYGETLARIGEYAGARSNPEVVAPLNKLQGILEKTSLNSGGKKETEKQNALLTEQNRLLRIIAEKELKLSPSPELGQVLSRSAALYGAV